MIMLCFLILNEDPTVVNIMEDNYPFPKINDVNSSNKIISGQKW